MGLEDYSPIEDNSGPKSSEISEKFKESAKKARAGIKRVQKDEKKAKKFDLLLSEFLVLFIKDSKYDELLQDIFTCLELGVSSKFIVAILSLIYHPISDKIREITNKEKLNFFYYSEKGIDFKDSELDEIVRNRINNWIEDILGIMEYEVSGIVDKRTIEIIKNKIVIDFTAKVFTFFFKKININVKYSTAFSYADFILDEVYKVMKKIDIEEV